MVDQLDCDLSASAGGGPEHLTVIMEGESLFNDASAIVLFQIFFGMVQKLNKGETPMDGGVLDQGMEILMKICVLGGGMPC